MVLIMEIKYSVIIPAYNAERTIKRCVESIVRQERDFAEIIIIDDGSTDRTGAIIQQLTGKYPEIKYIYQKNAGVSNARNRGLQDARGQFITFVDSDDYVSSDYFKQLENAGNADLAIFADTIIKNGKENIRDNWEKYIRGNTTDKICGILFSRLCGPCNKRYKNSIIKNYHIVFNPELHLGEDFLFNLSYMLKCTGIYSSRISIYFVDEESTTSLTRKPRNDFYGQSLMMYEKAFSMVQSSNIEKKAAIQIMRTLDYIFCRTAFACAEDVIDAGVKNTFAIIKELTMDFQRIKRGHVKSINFIHAVMQLVLEKKTTAVVYLTAKIHHLLIGLR